MSGSDELRRMLDERGVEYTQTIATEGILFLVITSEERYFILVRDNDAGIEMWSQYLTPEQAIAATLGRGECHITDSADLEDIAYTPEDTWAYKCSECGWDFRYDRGIKPKHCPNCGRKVVDI